MSKDEYAKIKSLILERMRAMEQRFDRLEEKIDLSNAQMRVMNQHVAGLVGSNALHEVENARVQDRLDRIERRLELRDA